MKANLLVTLLLTLLFTTAAISAYAQQEQPAYTFMHHFPINSGTAISTDRNGNVYLLDQRRNIVQLDSLGQPINVFSPPARGRIATIDAWNPMKILAFYQDRQQLLLLDRFLRPISSTSLSDFDLNGTIRAAALASDDSFWLFNETDFSLSKLDTRLRRITSDTPLNLILDKDRFDIRMIREYQNMVYLLDYNGGIYVFDNLGNYKKKLPYSGLSYIGFRSNELYFVKENKLHFLDLYTSQSKIVDLPEGDYTTALVNKNQLFLFSARNGHVYKW